MSKAGGIITTKMAKFYAHTHSTREDEIIINVHPSTTVVANFKNIEELVQGIVEILTGGKDKPV